MMPELVDQIRGYVLGQRNNVPGAKKQVCSVTHKSGALAGPTAFECRIRQIHRQIKAYRRRLQRYSSHSLRHHWNYSFSQTCESQGMTLTRRKAIHISWGGVNPGTAATYNRRHIKEQAGKAVLELQNKHLGKARKEDAA
ncbi:hypothetical protein AB6818_04540 [Carnobacterium maltaromaticum]|uniref:hypothetical protein n=1 Tax=Carnobacterium maltaromaticum TaxID=2751 RepID=UPI0039BEB92D